VKTLRAGGEASPLMLLSRVGMAVAGVVVVSLALLWRRKKRRA